MVDFGLGFCDRQDFSNTMRDVANDISGQMMIQQQLAESQAILMREELQAQMNHNRLLNAINRYGY